MYIVTSLKSKEFLILCMVAFLNLGGILYFQPYVINGDSLSYFETGKFLVGEPDGVLHANRIFKPLEPFIAVQLGRLVGGVESGLLLENTIWYIAIVPLIFLFLMKVLENIRAALWGSILYITSYPIMLYSVTYMIDMGSWFLTLLVLLWGVLFLKTNKLKYIVFAGITAGLGLLAKEYALSGAVFCGLVILTHQIPWREKIKFLIIFVLPIFCITGGWIAYSSTVFGANPAEWYLSGSASRYTLRDIPFVLKSIVGVFLLGWVLVVQGARNVFQNRQSQVYQVVMLLLAPSVLFFIWHAASSRIYFVAGPLLAVLASVGSEQFYESRRKLFWIVFMGAIALNYFWFLFGDGIREVIWPWYQH